MINIDKKMINIINVILLSLMRNGEMKMKKLIKLALVSLLSISALVGCSSNEGTKYDKNVDVLVLGAGGAGLSAAIEASDNGVEEVLVVETLGFIGGTTFISQGMIAGYETVIQKEQNTVPTTFDEMYDNLMLNASYRLDSDLTKITVEKSKDSIDWLHNRLDVAFTDDVIVGYGPLEMMHVVEGGGNGLLAPYQTALEEANIEVMTNTTAYEIIMTDDNKVEGVKCTTQDGEITIGAKSVIIATGGYSANAELAVLLDPEVKGTFGVGFSSCTGDGIIMGSNVGAALTHTNHLMAVLKDYEIMNDHNGDTNSATVSRFIAQPNTVLVGSDAKRFIDEKSGGFMTQELNRPIFNKMNQEDKSYVWALNDVATLAASEIKRGKDLEFITANTIAELAALMEVDAATLEKTINDYNSYVDAGFDPEFNRTQLAKISAPYVAVKVVPSVIITYGGLARNANAEVLRADSTVIEGLYVAGESAANSAFMGFTISNALTWGRIAGASAAAYNAK